MVSSGPTVAATPRTRHPNPAVTSLASRTRVSLPAFTTVIQVWTGSSLWLTTMVTQVAIGTNSAADVA